MSFGLQALRQDSRGASAVEFAVVCPVFLMILLGILTFGMYFGAAHSVAQLAADAARASVAGLSDAERSKIARELVSTSASEYVLINSKRIEVEAAPLPSDPTEFRVAVRYDAKDLPIWAFAPFVPLPSQTIERTATVKRGGY